MGGAEVPKQEVMKHQFSTHFPQEEGETLTMSEDPAKDPHFKVPVPTKVYQNISSDFFSCLEIFVFKN